MAPLPRCLSVVFPAILLPSPVVWAGATPSNLYVLNVLALLDAIADPPTTTAAASNADASVVSILRVISEPPLEPSPPGWRALSRGASLNRRVVGRKCGRLPLQGRGRGN